MDTIYYLYTTTDSRLSCRERSEVPRAYQKLFQQQEVPLTTDNLHVFLHDVGVSAMEVSQNRCLSLSSGLPVLSAQCATDQRGHLDLYLHDVNGSALEVCGVWFGVWPCVWRSLVYGCVWGVVWCMAVCVA